MIKIGFITTSINNANSIRGVGFYTKRLLPELKKQAPSVGAEIIEIENYLEIVNCKLDIIHYPYFDLFKHSLPIIKSTKTIVTIHDVIPLEFPEHYPVGFKGLVNLQLQRLALNSVDRVVTDSYASIKAIRKYLNIPHHKLKLVYLAADPIFRKKPKSKIKNKYNLPQKFVLYVGDVNYNKNIPGLIAACKQAKLPLVMAGRHAKELETMDLSHPELAHLKNLGLDYPLRLGFVSDEDLVDIYNLATVYCQPSFAEGFGLPVLEALACGTPVACSRIGSLSEIAGSAATYFDPHNVTEMAEAILKVQNNKVPKFRSKFSWEKTARETLMVYQEVLHGH